jgi:hypothetical protein
LGLLGVISTEFEYAGALKGSSTKVGFRLERMKADAVK